MVLVVGGDIPDGFVQPDRVVFASDPVEFGVEAGGVLDVFEVGPFPLRRSKKLSMLACSVGVWGRPWCCTMVISAIKVRVSPAVFSGPLSDHATSTGPWSLSLRRMGRPSGPRSPWNSRASPKA